MKSILVGIVKQWYILVHLEVDHITFYFSLIDKNLYIALLLSCYMLYNEVTKSFFFVEKLTRISSLTM